MFKSRFILILLIQLLCEDIKADWKTIDSIPQKGGYYDNVMLTKKIKCYDNGFCVQLINLSDRMPLVKISNDNGKTWETTLLDTNKFIGSAYYVASHLDDIDCYGNDCITLGDTNFYWLSNDKAKTWKKYGLSINRMHSDVGLSVKCYKDIWIAKFGSYNTNVMYFSKNKGLGWDSISIKTPDSLLECSLQSFELIKDSKIKTVMYSYSKAKTFSCETFDFGKTWVSYDYAPKRIIDFHFFDENIGIGAGAIQLKSGSGYYSSYIAKTLDGGKTWKTILDTLMKIDGGLRKVQFVDDKNGIAFGAYELWKTSDGGDTWMKDLTYNEKRFSPDYGYSSDATLLKDGRILVLNNWHGKLWENTNFVTSVDENPTIINNISYYPNPSRETLNLKLSTEPELNEELTITDILGNNVLKIPIKEMQNQIDISHLISGLYLCKLRQSGTVFKIEVVR